MKIAAHQLSAFFETARMKSFTKAAERLNITQSALSQRIANLESDLEVTLFVRDTSGPLLTSAGETLLRHCQVQIHLEDELLSDLKSTVSELAGTLRIAGFSSIVRSVLVPSLAPFLRRHRKVQCEFRSYEVVDLPEVLRTGQADLVVIDYHLQRSGVTEHILGLEDYVVIESARHAATSDPLVYLDHGPHDNATESYFASQANPPKGLRRGFMGDVYGIIDGVEEGLGRAVMSKHLIQNNRRVRVVKGYKRYTRSVTLNYFTQPYYSRLHREVVKVLLEGAAEFGLSPG